jgi:hypothetical protein
MASLSNINGLFDVHSTGAILFSNTHGTSGQILRSNGNAAPTWVAASTVIGGPYLPLTGGTLSGATATATGISFTVGGVLTTQGTAYLENNVYVGNTSNEFLETRYNSTSDYAARYTWKGLQFGNNGINKIVAGRTGVNGYLNFYVNNTNDGLANTPDGTLALTLAADATATFAGNVLIPSGYIKLGGYSFIGEDLTDTDSLTIASHYTESIYFAHENAGVYTTTVIIDPSGDVGINTTNPSAKLHTVDDGYSLKTSRTTGASENLLIGNKAAAGIVGTTYPGQIVSSGNNIFEMYTSGAQPLVLGTASTHRVYISGTGRVGLGTTNPSTLLSLQSTLNNSLGGISLIGNSPGDKSNIWTQDIYSKWLHTENSTDAGNGYGRIDFETNAALNATYPTRGGFSFKTAGAGQFVTFTNQGRVGIGTSLPNRKLNVQGSSSYTYPSGIDNNSFFGIANNGWAGMNIFATPTTGGFIDFGDTDAGWRGRILYSHADDSMAFSTSAITRMRVQSNGSVGIGIETASTSTVKLRVVSDVNANWACEIKSTNTAGNTYGLVVNTLAGAGTYNLGCYTHTGNGFFVQNDGKVAIGTGAATEGRFHVTQSYSAALRTGYFQSSAYSAPHVTYDTFAINQQDVPSLVLVETPAAAVSTHQKLSITVGDNNCVFRTSQVSGGMWFNVNGNVSSPGYQTGIGTNAIRILNNADVGIGTSTPTEKLSIKGDNQSVEEILRVRTGNSSYSNAGASLGVAGYEGEMNVYDSANVKRIYLSSHYNCYINPKGPGFTFIGSTTGPNAKLYVEGTNTTNAARFYGYGGTVAPLELRQDNTAGWFAKFYSDNFGTYVGGISFYGSSTTFNTSSDYRLKENIIPISDSITRLKQLKPSRFNFKQYPEITIDGFLAHEVQKIVPEAVTGDKDELDSDGKPVYQAIDHSRLIPLLVASIQELETRVKELENK